MTYQWKLPSLMPVDAQSAGEELDRIYQKRGSMTPGDIVEESRPQNALLHACFEWKDSIAAERYREIQASNIVRNITVIQNAPTEPKNIRAFVCVQKSYHPVGIVLSDEEKASELLQTAFRELKAFKEKYATLSELVTVFDAIDAATTMNRKENPT